MPGTDDGRPSSKRCSGPDPTVVVRGTDAQQAPPFGETLVLFKGRRCVEHRSSPCVASKPFASPGGTWPFTGCERLFGP
ncbi:MAG: hypothetical protein JW849_05335 [Phycisphaerae bacterium]|nr:hypothetical protein [Phycisphaerae bacterium]